MIHRFPWHTQRRAVALMSPERRMMAMKATKPCEPYLESIAPVLGFPIRVL